MRFLNIRWCVLIIGLILVTACTNEAETDEDISALEQEQLEEQQVEQQIEQVDALDVAQREQQDQRGEHNHSQIEPESSPHREQQIDEIDYVFPESVEITFEEVELINLEPNEPTASWELVHSISLGKIEDEQVELEVYQVSDSDAPCSSNHEAAGMLVYQGQSYGLSACLSYSFLHEDSRGQDVIELGERFVDDILGIDVILQGAVALTANGPGRMGYLYYDQLEDNWSMFIDWGMPVITDLDEDGQRELVIQFQGLHLSWPDVAIYRWQDGILEASDSVKIQLDIPSMSFNEALLIEQDKQILINLFVNDHEELEETISATYIYSDGTLIKQDE